MTWRRASVNEMQDITDPLGNRFNLSNGGTKAILSEAGAGQPPIEYLTTSGPFQDGATVRGYRLRPRTYILLLRWQACDRDGYWRKRAELLDILRPNRQTLGEVEPFVLRRVFGDGTRRSLAVFPASGPEFATDPARSDPFGFSDTIRLIAFDPLWYDPIAQTLTFSATAAASLVFPFTMPFLFGSTYSASDTLTYAGTWPEYPVIEVDGPFTRAQVINVTTGETLDLTYAAVLGETVTFDLRYGVKSVTTNLGGTSLIGDLSTDSDLATWHLEPDPGAPGGANQVSVSLDNGAGGAQIRITWYSRFTAV